MRRERGFTLLELVAVLVLVGILAVFALPRLAGPSDFAARGAYEQVRSGLRYARQSAIAMRRNVCVDLATTQITLRYAAANGAAQSCPAANLLIDPANGRPFGDPANALPSGAALAAAGTLRFDAQGRPYDGSGSALTATASFIVGGYPQAVIVEPETGVVR